MGLLSSRNLRKAKSLLEQNRHKVGELVGKATEQVDKVSKGKTANVSAKVEEAARKYSEGGVTHHDAATSGQMAGQAPSAGSRLDDAEIQRRQAEANIAAANALRSAADAAAGVFGKMAAQTGADAASPTEPAAGAASPAEPDASPDPTD